MTRWYPAVAFLAIVIVILAGIHAYLWARLVRDPGVPSPWRQILLAALVALGTALPLTMLAIRFWPPTTTRWLAWPVFVWLGLVLVFFALLLAGDVVRLVAWTLAHLRADSPANPDRRAHLARLWAGGVAGVTAAVGGFGARQALRPATVKDVSVPLARLPAAHDGMTIVQLTDLHVGPTIGRAFIEDIVRRTNALAPDLIAVTGDLMDGSVAHLRESMAPMADLRARHGVFFVTGNHEYFSGVEAWLPELERLGMRVLRNERVSIGGDGPDGFDLAGVDDASAARSGVPGHRQDVARALAGRDPSREVVLLAHQPRAIDDATAHGVGLQLSGHTHAGQIWPFTFVVKLLQPYVAGLHRRGDTWIYVSQGTGYWGPPMRVATEPEITRVTLRRAG